MDTTENVTIDATTAKSIAEKVQSGNLENALKEIDSRAKMGFNEAILFGANLDFNGIKKLMDLGFSVTNAYGQVGERYIKVSWY